MDIKSFLVAKNYIDTVISETNLQGKSAYEIALDNGFEGSEAEWLESLKGVSPHIGENGNWFIGDVDTGASASPNLDGYYHEGNLIPLTEAEILEICKIS